MEQKSKKVLVTGASGFVGSHLCEELLSRGYKVVGFVYGGKEKIAHLEGNKNFEVVEGDVTDSQKTFQILENSKPEAVFHTAVLITKEGQEEDSNLLFKVNVQGTNNLLEACRILGIKNIIYSSSMSVYGSSQKDLPVKEGCEPKPHSFYGLSKLMGEECAKLYANVYKLNVIILRYTGIYGFRKNEGAVFTFLKNAIDNKPLEILSGANWDVVCVKDVVLANISALERINKIKFETINIGSGKGINIKSLAEKIIKISGSKSIIKIKKKLLRFCFCADISKAKKLLKFKTTPLETGLRQYFQELKK